MNRIEFFTAMKTDRGVWKRTVPMVLVLALLVTLVGGAAAAPVVIDLQSGQQDLTIWGDEAEGYLSEIATSADFNGDGIGDLLIGAAGHNRNGQYSGASYLILGKSTMPTTIDLAAQKANVTIYGVGTQDAFGHSVAGGDVNGDGFRDMIIAADGEEGGRGAVYVFLTNANTGATPTTIDLKVDTGKAALKIKGENTDWRLGRSVASGDVNGDGIDDIVIGSFYASPGGRLQAGAVYVVLGSTSITTSVSTDTFLVNTRAALTIYGAGGDPDGLTTLKPVSASSADAVLFADLAPQAGEIGDRLGRSVVVADMNRDGKADILSGAYGANVGTAIDAGKTYIINGSAAYTTTAGTVIDLSTGTGASSTISGVANNDQAGFILATGDINKDTYPDVLLGAYTSNAEAGRAYVVYGKAAMPAAVNLADATHLNIAGAAGERLGRSIASGDVNKDGFEDVLIGASRAAPNGRTGTGAIYIFYGKAALTGATNSTNADLTIWGPGVSNYICSDTPFPTAEDCSDEIGHSVSSGDINGDSVDDIIAGSIYANHGTLIDAGAAYVIYGVDEGQQQQPTSISIFPKTKQVQENEKVSFTVMAQDAASKTWDITSRAVFSVTPANAGTWKGNLFTPQMTGTFTVKATYGGLTDTATLTVGTAGPTSTILYLPQILNYK